MFRETVCFLALLCGTLNIIEGYINSESEFKGYINSESEFETHEFYPNRLRNPARTEVKDGKRLKRGIALVDEDFDVPASAHNGIKEYDGIYDEVEFERGFDSSGDEAVERPSQDITKSLRMNADDQTEPVFKDIPVKKTLQDDQLQSDFEDITHKTTELRKITESINEIPSHKTTNKLVDDYNLVSSGDEMLHTKEYSTTELSTERNLKPFDESFENLPDKCLNSTCNSSDLSIQVSEESSLIPEGVNLTLTCRSNISNHHGLYWYKNNGSTYMLQTFGSEQLQLILPYTKTFHSGQYKCVSWVNRESCCNMESYITVYEVPPYRYHLIVIALIAAVGLLVCIFLGIRQSISLKKYTKDFVKRHGSVKQQLL